MDDLIDKSLARCAWDFVDSSTDARASVTLLQQSVLVKGHVSSTKSHQEAYLWCLV